jgi:hypothetical protein
MPLLDSCINAIFEPGNIGSSSGTPPTVITPGSVLDPVTYDPDTVTYSLDYSKFYNSMYLLLLMVGGGGLAETSGWPSADNTGPDPGVTLVDSGSITISSPSVVSGLRVTGSITINSSGVTVQDCEVKANGELYGIGVPDNNSITDARIIRCRVYSDAPVCTTEAEYDAAHLFDGIKGGAEVAFCDVSACENAVSLVQADPYIHDNYFHDFANYRPIADNHVDGVQTYGLADTGGLLIIHNTILGQETTGNVSTDGNTSSCIALISGQHDITIDNNFLAGGGYTIYGPSQAAELAANVHVTNNHFSRSLYPNGGFYGTHTGFDLDGVGFVWSGNVWDETGLPLLATDP